MLERGHAAPLGALLVLVTVVALVATACAGNGDGRAAGTTLATTPDGIPLELGTAPATLAEPPDFVQADTRGIVIPPVLSRVKDAIDHNKPTLPVEGGTSTIHGVIYGPDGPLDGAVVRLERFVAEDWGFLDVGTNKDGKYSAVNILGGRYRVRAFQKPSLATVEPSVLFLPADHADVAVDVVTERHEGVQLQGALVTGEPHVGEHLLLQTLLTHEEVDDDGIVQGVPIPGNGIALTPIEGIKRFGPIQQLTGPDGYVAFDVMCLTPGPHSVILDSGENPVQIDLVPCLDGEIDPRDLIDPPPGASTTTTTTTKPGSPTTTTTKKPGPSTTTTTKKPGP